MSVIESIVDMPAEHSQNVFGSCDAYMKKIEKTLHVTFVARDSELKVIGAETAVSRAVSVINELMTLSRRGNVITEQNVDYALAMSMDDNTSIVSELDEDVIARTINGKPIKPKTLGQKHYIDEIRNKMIVFGIGPAGTGKTFVAIALAVKALKNKEIRKIILSRPAVEAGEKLGFLPGEMKDKLDPYLQPLYDALQDMVPGAKLKEYMENNVIQIAPLAFMRGRTLNDAVIILDEAQNTTPEQMKMFLTRMGVGSKVVVTGDVTQIDLPDRTRSGLVDALQVLKGVNGIAQCYFTEKDVVRHRLVQEIIKAYEAAAHPAKH